MAAVRAKIDAAEWAADLSRDLRDYADSLCDPDRRERNPPDWKVQNGLPKRVTALALAYKLTGGRKYLDRAGAEMLELCRQPEFVRAAEERRRPDLPMYSGVTGLAYGYDALRDDLPAETLAEVERALLAGGFDRLYDPVDGELLGTPRDAYANNWTHVIWGGAVVAAVALADKYPDRCAQVIRDGVPRCVAVANIWGPDGVSPEGTHYWDFGAHRYYCMLDALETGLGASFGLADDPLLQKCARWRVAARGPAGDFPLRRRGPAELLRPGPLLVGDEDGPKLAREPRRPAADGPGPRLSFREQTLAGANAPLAARRRGRRGPAG